MKNAKQTQRQPELKYNDRCERKIVDSVESQKAAFEIILVYEI